MLAMPSDYIWHSLPPSHLNQTCGRENNLIDPYFFAKTRVIVFYFNGPISLMSCMIFSWICLSILIPTIKQCK